MLLIHSTTAVAVRGVFLLLNEAWAQLEDFRFLVSFERQNKQAATVLEMEI
jgi:hypothetical protein